jgi:hypothetical protein
MSRLCHAKVRMYHATFSMRHFRNEDDMQNDALLTHKRLYHAWYLGAQREKMALGLQFIALREFHL